MHLYPWLRDLDYTEGMRAPQRHTTPADGEPAVDESNDFFELDDEAVERAMQELEDARSSLQAEALPSEDFKTRLVHRTGLMQERGLAAQAIIGTWITESAYEYCRRHGIQHSASFSTETYGVGPCGVLARAWAHKMQHCLNAERNRAENINAEAPEYLEPAELTKLATIAAGL